MLGAIYEASGPYFTEGLTELATGQFITTKDNEILRKRLETIQQLVPKLEARLKIRLRQIMHPDYDEENP